MVQNIKKVREIKKKVMLAAAIFSILLAAIYIIGDEYLDRDKTVYHEVDYYGISMKYPSGYFMEQSIIEDSVKYKMTFTSPKRMEQFLDKIITVTWDKKAKTAQEVFELFKTFDGFDGLSFIRDYTTEFNGEKCNVIDYTVYGMLYGRFYFMKVGDNIVVYQTEADKVEKLDEKVFDSVRKSIHAK